MQIMWAKPPSDVDAYRIARWLWIVSVLSSEKHILDFKQQTKLDWYSTHSCGVVKTLWHRWHWNVRIFTREITWISAISCNFGFNLYSKYPLMRSRNSCLVVTQKCEIQQLVWEIRWALRSRLVQPHISLTVNDPTNENIISAYVNWWIFLLIDVLLTPANCYIVYGDNVLTIQILLRFVLKILERKMNVKVKSIYVSPRNALQDPYSSSLFPLNYDWLWCRGCLFGNTLYEIMKSKELNGPNCSCSIGTTDD